MHDFAQDLQLFVIDVQMFAIQCLGRKSDPTVSEYLEVIELLTVYIL